MQPRVLKTKPNKFSEHENDSQQFQQNIFFYNYKICTNATIVHLFHQQGLLHYI
jgi:hypothetical protein